MTGTQISNMDPSVTLPDGAVVPFVVPPATPGFDPALNYIYDLGADLLTRVSYTALAAPTAAAQVGSTDGNVQADIDARPTAADLAAPSGGTMVGTKQTGSGTKDRTALSKANDIVALTDFDGVTFDGSTDDSAGLTKAIDDGRSLLFPNGTMKIDSALQLSASSLYLAGNGENSVLDFSGGGSLELIVEPTALPNLATDITAGSDTAVFVSAHGLVEGQVFIVWNPTDYSFAPFRDYYRDGRMFRVREVVDTETVRFYGGSPRAFAAADMQCYKMEGGPVVLRDFRIIPDPAGNIPISITGHQSVVIDGVTVEKGALIAGISIGRCYDFDIILAKSTTLDTTANNCYPLLIANSQNGRIRGGSYYSNRHCISLGGGNETATPPCADILIEGLNLYNNGRTGIGAADIHGVCENITYSDCIINNVANVSGRNITVKGCTIYGNDPVNEASSTCVYGDEVVGGVYRFENNRFITYRTEAGTGFGAIHLIVADRSENFTFIARGNTLEHRGTSATLRAHYLVIGSTAGSYRVDTQIEDFTYISSVTLLQVLSLDGTADISAQSRHSIDRLFGCNGATLIAASASANYSAPLRLPTVSGSVTISANSGSNSGVASAQSLPYTYPRTPHGSATCTSIANAGSRRALGSLNGISATTITPAIMTGDNSNWTDTQNRTVNWTAGIRDF